MKNVEQDYKMWISSYELQTQMKKRFYSLILAYHYRI